MNKSIPCLPLRPASTHNLSFIQTLNVTVVVWHQLLVQDTNAPLPKTLITAQHVKRENLIHIRSSRSIDQNRHQLLYSPPLMKMLQEKLILKEMLNKTQHFSEIEAQLLVMDQDLSSSKTWCKTSPKEAGEAEENVVVGVAREEDVVKVEALEEWWEAWWEMDAHSEAKATKPTDKQEDHSKMVGDWKEQKLSQSQVFWLVPQGKPWSQLLTFRTTHSSHTSLDVPLKVYSKEELLKFLKMLLYQLTSKWLHSKSIVSTFHWRSRKALMSLLILAKNIILLLSNSMDLEEDILESNSTSSLESNRRLMRLTSTTRLWCSLKRSLKISTLMRSLSRRLLRLSRKPKEMPTWPRSSLRKWEKAPSSLHLANSNRWLSRMKMRKIFTPEIGRSLILYFETYISNHQQARHQWQNVKVNS